MDESTLKEQTIQLFKELEARVKSLEKSEYLTLGILKNIEEARNLLNKGKTDEVRRACAEIESKVGRAEVSVQSEPLAWNLFKIEVAYLLLILALGYLTAKWPSFRLWVGLIGLNVRCAWFGALGGVAVALYGLYSHIQARDFDPKYKLWYVCKPIMGAIFGWFVFLVYFVGLVSVQGGSGVDIKTPQLPYAIAFLAGFSERFTIRIVDRLMQVLSTWEETPSGTPKMF